MEELLAGVQQILDIYVANGYALKATITPGSSGGGGSGRPTLSPVDGTSAASAGSSFTVKLEGPANLWSLQVRMVGSTAGFKYPCCSLRVLRYSVACLRAIWQPGVLCGSTACRRAACCAPHLALETDSNTVTPAANRRWQPAAPPCTTSMMRPLWRRSCGPAGAAARAGWPGATQGWCSSGQWPDGWTESPLTHTVD